MPKRVLVALAVVVPLALASLLLRLAPTASVPPEIPPAPTGITTPVRETYRTHRIPEAHLTFQYRAAPNPYHLLVAAPKAGDHPDLVKRVTLMLETDYAALGSRVAGEGPPTMNIDIYKNPKKYAPRAWAEAYPDFSNFHLAVGEVFDGALGEGEAIRYAVDGLYHIDTHVVRYGEYIYIVSGAYLDETSPTRVDFPYFLGSISFADDTATAE